MTASGTAPNHNRILLLIGGDDDSVDPAAMGELTGASRSEVGRPRLVVAADSGLHLAQSAGLTVDHVVGDMDSVDHDVLAAFEGAGAIVHRHAADKDATDLELALDLVCGLVVASGDALGEVPAPRAERTRLEVVSGGGGRLDHLLGTLLMLAGPRLAHLDVFARIGRASVWVVRGGRAMEVPGRPGEHLSLLAAHGDAHEVNATGLRWPLIGGFLAAGSSRAMSNEFTESTATVSLAVGTLLVIAPGTTSQVPADRAGPYDPSPPIAPGHALDGGGS